MVTHEHNSTSMAVQAVAEGYTPLPIQGGSKRPYGGGWQHQRWTGKSEAEIAEHFDAAREAGAGDIGLLLGAPSGGLVDIDFDHALSLRFRDILIPPTAMETGRAGRARSHKWFIAEPTDDLPSTRQYKMPDGSVIIELRATGAQTVIPHSTHPSGELYRWEGEPWGGEVGPARVDGKVLSIQVALTAMAAVLLDRWPKKGGRHEAYLHLAGWLLRHGEGVHPYWERNLSVLVGALAEATHDEDGPQTRIDEVVGTTIRRINEGGRVSGLPSLVEVIGQEHADALKRLRSEVESLSGFVPEVVSRDVDIQLADPAGTYEGEHDGDDELPDSAVDEERGRDPLEERVSSWASVDLGPYLTGEVSPPEPTVLRRTDGQALFYAGKVNSLFGQSESAKSWIALHAGVQEMKLGERVMYLDLEDDPVTTIARLRALGAADEDMKMLFRYVHPETPLATMQRSRYGKPDATDEGRMAASVFKALLDKFDPTLVIVDGMTVLYGLHGLDTNDSMGTDVITGWLKSLTRGSRTTVIVIDHTSKGGGPGSAPIGSQHKTAMIQGSSLRADPIDRPMPGAVGLVRLIVSKDRPGAVRAASTQDKEQVAADITIDSTTAGRTRMTVEAPNASTVVIGATDAQEQKLVNLAEAEAAKESVLDLFGGELGLRLTTREVRQQLGLKPDVIYDVWKLLELEGVVIREGERRWTKFRLRDDLRD